MNKDVKEKLAELNKNKESKIAATPSSEETKTFVAKEATTVNVSAKEDILKPVKDINKEDPSKLFHVFYSSKLSSNMITTTGRYIVFVNGRYVTNSEEEINYLKTEIALGNPFLSVVEGKEIMSAEDLDPMAALKKQHIAEYLEEQKTKAAAIRAGILPESVSEVQMLTPGSTSDVKDVAAGSV